MASPVRQSGTQVLLAPGMTMMKMPVFTWMSLVTQLLLVFALPVISVALFLLTFARLFGANFFNVAEGADPAVAPALPQ